MIKMDAAALTCFLILASTIHCSVSSSNNAENYCLNSIYHKSEPSSDDGLADECSSWKDKSCCHANTTQSVIKMELYNFDYHHCGRLSKACSRFFVLDSCFYECSPNIGPWVIQDVRKVRQERFLNVPLCKSECERWYIACQNDLTCVENWGQDFQWFDEGKGRTNMCKNSTCIPISKMYGNPRDFCEKVWDHSWEYTDNKKPCMKFEFESGNNPNEAVTKAKLVEIGNTGATYCASFFAIILFAADTPYI